MSQHVLACIHTGQFDNLHWCINTYGSESEQTGTFRHSLDSTGENTNEVIITHCL